MERFYTYAEAEGLLAGLHGVQDEQEQRGAFRGRLKHLKRLGVPLGSNPGRGQKTKYGRSHLYQWDFCLSLQEFGIDPSVIVVFLSNNWDGFILPTYRDATSFFLLGKKQKRIYMTFIPKFVSRRGGESPLGNIGALATGDEAELTTLRKLAIRNDESRRCFFDLTPLVVSMESVGTLSTGGA